MGTLLAATFWPLVCSRTTMENVWHTAEWLFNTVLFQLAGLIIGASVIPDVSARALPPPCMHERPCPPSSLHA